MATPDAEWLVGPGRWDDFREQTPPFLTTMAAGSGGRYLADDILAEIDAGRMSAWLSVCGAVVTCVMVTQVIHYPRFKALRYVGIAGKIPKNWSAALTTIAASAYKDHGCRRLEALHPPGRYGVLRFLGWRTFHVLSEATL